MKAAFIFLSFLISVSAYAQHEIEFLKSQGLVLGVENPFIVKKGSDTLCDAVIIPSQNLSLSDNYGEDCVYSLKTIYTEAVTYVEINNQKIDLNSRRERLSILLKPKFKTGNVNLKLSELKQETDLYMMDDMGFDAEFTYECNCSLIRDNKLYYGYMGNPFSPEMRNLFQIGDLLRYSDCKAIAPEGERDLKPQTIFIRIIE